MLYYIQDLVNNLFCTLFLLFPYHPRGSVLLYFLSIPSYPQFLIPATNN